MVAVPRPRPDESATAELLRAQLDTLLSAPDFKASPRRRKLLTYLVEQTLAGRAERLKAFDIAVAVLGRDERFDPKEDPIVRMEARRLRHDLEEYYQTAGAHDRVRIDIPKGGYVPTLTLIETEAAPVPAATPVPPAPRRRLVTGLALAVGVLAIVLVEAMYGIRPWLPAEQTNLHDVEAGKVTSPVVMPFESLNAGEAEKLLPRGLPSGRVRDPPHLEQLGVYAGIVPPGVPAAPPPPVTLRLDGSVIRDEARIRVAARLIDTTTGEVQWSDSFERHADMAAVLEIQDDLAARVAERLALPNGVLAVAAERYAASRPRDLSSFDCVQRAVRLRRLTDGTDRAGVTACLEEAVAREPDYADAWAMLSWMLLDTTRLQLPDPVDIPSAMQAGRVAAERAIALAPRSSISLRALANVYYQEGDFAEAERLFRRTLELYPQDPETRAQLGWRMVARGEIAEGNAMLREAIARSWRSPNWYHTSLAVGLFLNNEPEAAYEEALLGQRFPFGVGQFVLAVMAASLGHDVEARSAAACAVAEAPLLRDDPRAFLRGFHYQEPLIDRLVAGFPQPGVGATCGNLAASRTAVGSQ